MLNLSFFEAKHTRLLGYKLIAVTIMLAVSGVHDWHLGPKATELAYGSEKAEQYRKIAGWLGRVTGILVILIVCLAVFVARPWV